jgi:D-Tyr-tRNAtyr deacylase
MLWIVVSQFTLYGVLKGNKPDYHNAMPPTQAKEFYSNFLGEVRKTYKADKIFGKYKNHHYSRRTLFSSEFVEFEICI